MGDDRVPRAAADVPPKGGPCASQLPAPGETGATVRREETIDVRHYEAMYILDPALTEEQVPPIIERYSKVVTDMGGEVSDASLWEGGRRSLAYTIAGRREGIYVLMQFVAGKDVPAELDRLFKISDNVLRHIVVRPDPDEE